jgi:hypothetical protein
MILLLSPVFQKYLLKFIKRRVILITFAQKHCQKEKNMARVKDYATGNVLYEWGEGVLRDSQTGKGVYQMKEGTIQDLSSGQNKYKWDGLKLSDYVSGEALYELEDHDIRDFRRGGKIYSIDKSTLKNYETGQGMLETEGTVPVPILMAITHLMGRNNE